MIRISSIGVLAAVVVVGLFINGVVFAGHNGPEEAEEFETSLIRAFAACTLENANDTTPNLGLPACSPSVPLDSVCGIDPNEGEGEVQLQVVTGDIEIDVEVEGLTGCDGETLSFVATTRVTTDGCSSGADCTAIDVSLPAGSCVVSGGECEISTTVNSEIPGALVAGNNAGLEILGCGLVRTTGPGAPAQTLSCGLLVNGEDDDDDDDDD